MAAFYDRREFLQKTALTAGALAAGYTATAKGYAANETLQVACIGTGGRCRGLMRELANIKGVKITAVCDVWDQHLAEGRKLADAKAAATKEFRELLDRPDVDAVLIGSPDHWHVPMTIAACQAGKDVYVEKPFTHELSEGQAVIDAQHKHKRIVQVGTQQRSMPHFQKAAEIVKSGQLGNIYKVHLTWNRNQERAKRHKLGIDANTVDWKRFLGTAKKQPFDEYRFRNWRWFWDFGGGIFTDLMVHFIDVAHWFLGLDHPAIAASIGDHFATAGVWETPDTVQTLLRYPKQATLTRRASEESARVSEGTQVYFEGTFVNARNAAMLEFMGSEATLYLDRGRYEIHPERKSRVRASQLVLSKSPDTRGADFYDQPNGELLHLANWVECIRSRQAPTCPAEAGVSAAAAAHLANLSLRRGEVARWGT